MGAKDINGTSTYDLVRELDVKFDAMSAIVLSNQHDLKGIKVIGGAIASAMLVTLSGLVLLFASSIM